MGWIMGEVIRKNQVLLIDDRHRDYQKDEITRIGSGESRLLFHGVGAGKTTQVLHAARSAYLSGHIERTFLFSTGAIIKGVWSREIEEWPLLKGLEYRHLHGTPDQRMAQLHAALKIPGAVIGISFDLIQWFQAHCGFALTDPFAVVFDEISVIRNPRGKRFRAAIQIAAAASIRVGMTGSPTPNRVSELFGPVALIDLGERFGTSITRFEQKVLVKYGRRPWQVRDRPEMREPILERIRGLSSTIRTEDVADLPEIIYRTIPVELPEDIRREVYNPMIGGHDTVFDRDIDEIAIGGALQQVCSGWRYDESGANAVHLHDAKIDAVTDVLDGLLADGHQVLCLYQWAEDRARLLDRFKGAVALDASADVANILERWNRGQVSLILSHPKCLHPSTEVLTEQRGWRRIVDVHDDDRVFDGVEFVSHGGCRYSGVKEVIEIFGMTMTPDHKLLIGDEWLEAAHVRDSGITAREASRGESVLPESACEVLLMRSGGRDQEAECCAGQQAFSSRVPLMPQGCFETPGPQDLAWHAGAGNQAQLQEFPPLRRCGAWCVERVAALREFLSRHGGLLRRGADSGAYRQLQRVLQGELSLGHEHGAAEQQVEQSVRGVSRAADAPGRAGACDRVQQDSFDLSNGKRDDSKRSCGIRSEQPLRAKQGPEVYQEPKRSEVYDLINCGPRHQFLIRNPDGLTFISHNSCAHGLNLQKAPRGGFVVWVSPSWSSELWEQANGRVYRPGATHAKAHVISIIVEDSIEETVRSVLWKKVSVQDAVRLALAEERARTKAPDLAALLKEARVQVQRSHPDRGGSPEAFHAAWSRYQSLKSRIEAEGL
jgi:hypothetical protein